MSTLQEVVYHYTSLEGLMGILNSQAIHATAIDYLNDLQEQRLFLEHAASELRNSIEYEGITGEALTRLLAEVNTGPLPNAMPLFLDRPFVASFSLKHDYLPQWRAYCSNGSGICIGFNTQKLREAYLSSNGERSGTRVPLWANRMNYVSDINKSSLTERVRFCYRWAKQTLAEHPQLSADMNMTLDRIFARHLDSLAPFYTHESFESESEWRLSVSSFFEVFSCVAFKPKRTTLVPYVPLLLPRNGETTGDADVDRGNAVIVSVTVGPTPNMRLSIDSVRCLLALQGIRAEVRAFTSPYREW